MTAYRVVLKSTTATVLTPYTFDHCVASCRARFGGEFVRLEVRK